MTKSKAKITYLFHSGYAVETMEHFFIFDYYQPFHSVKRSISDGIITSEYLTIKKNVLVFSSHAHADHFDPIILDWAKDNPEIDYVLSSDIPLAETTLKHHIVSAYQEIKVGNVTIKTFGSTDQGVSFLIETDGLSIFHAGDLNWWHWSGESREEQLAAENNFKAEIGKIIGQNISIAFFPIDRRLEEAYCMGAEYFATKLKPTILLPMHFGNDFSATKAFAERAKTLSITTSEISRKGQEIIF